MKKPSLNDRKTNLFQLSIILLLLGLFNDSLAQVAGNQNWLAPTLGDVRSSPAIDAAGNLYIGCRITNGNTYSGRLYKLDSQGNELWHYDMGDWVDASPVIDDGGTPADILDDQIYIGSWDSYLYALDASGNLLWNFPTSSLIVSSPAIAEDGTLYLGGTDGFLYAIDPDGNELWSNYLGDDIDSSPAIGADGTIYVGCYDGKLYAINPDGSDAWTFATLDNYALTGLNNRIISSPCIDGDGNIYFGSGNGYCYALDSAGNELWSLDTGAPVDSSPIISNLGTLYFASESGYLYSIDSNGFTIWSLGLGSSRQSTPIIDSNDNVYLAVYDEDAVTGQVGLLYCISDNIIGEPSISWAFPFLDDVFSSPAMDAAGNIIIGSDEDALHSVATDSVPVESIWPKFQRDSANQARVALSGAPVVVSLPSFACGLKGDRLQVSVESSGNGPLFYNWYQNGLLLETQNSRTLTIDSLGDTDLGKYHVTIFNTVGSVTSDELYISYVEFPEFSAGVGESMNLTYGIPSGTTDGIIIVESSSDLQSWAPEGEGIFLGTTALADRYTFSLSVDGMEVLLLRLNLASAAR